MTKTMYLIQERMSKIMFQIQEGMLKKTRCYDRMIKFKSKEQFDDLHVTEFHLTDMDFEP